MPGKAFEVLLAPTVESLRQAAREFRPRRGRDLGFGRASKSTATGRRCSDKGKTIAFDGVMLDMTAQENAEAARLEERARIAQELHDTLLQTFQSASLHLGAALYRVADDSPVKPQLDRILLIMRQGIAEGRDAIRGLRSSDTHKSDLILDLSQTREEFEVGERTQFCVRVTGTQTQLPQQIHHEIYRIAREALANAFRHSGAKRVELEAEYSGTGLCLRIRDDGCGIDPQLLEKGREGHWGLIAMRERATRIGARLTIFSRATQGTEVQLSIPTGDQAGTPGRRSRRGKPIEIVKGTDGGNGVPWSSTAKEVSHG
jgi:signal transduction histidine kinase